MAVKSENLNSNSISRLYKQNKMLKFMEIKSNEPKLTQKQICNQLGHSDSTIKQFKEDNIMNSPYKTKKYRKKTSKTQTQSHTTSEVPKILKILKTTIPQKEVIQTMFICLEKN